MKRKKVASPTGKPSRISSGNKDALAKFEAGQSTGGKRPPPPPPKKKRKKRITDAELMDAGRPVNPKRKR